MTVRCTYCGQKAALVSGDVVYPNRADLSSKRFWLCQSCGAYVGCHRGTSKPLGTLADASLRKARMAAHAAFDPVWQRGGDRNEAYAWLARELGIAKDVCHIGMMDAAQCRRVVEVCKQRA